MKVLSNIYLTVAVMTIFLVGACAQTPAAPDDKLVMAQTNPIESVTSLETDIASARQNQLNVLSPDWFEKAEEFYAKAKKDAERGSEISDILENVANGKNALLKAEETSKVSRTMLPEVLESRNKAHQAGAANLGEDYADVEGQFLDLTRAIEDNNIRYTQKNAPKVKKAYLDLELLAIKTDSIGKVRPLIAQAIDEKAEKYAPLSLAMAQKSVDDTDNFITGNRYAKQAIDQKVKESMFLAQRAIILNNQSKALEKMKPEEIALGMEKNLHQITTQLSAQDSRNQAVGVQVGTILGVITQLQEKNRSLNASLDSQKKENQERSALYESQVAVLNHRIAILEGTTIKDQKVKATLLAEQKSIEQKLANEREFNKKYLEVQTFFRANEAEVYKQRNQLVIRLKAMQFPVGTAIISPENFALLSKVQRAIQTFDGPSVVVEGHTDSTGGDEINRALSKQRAEAVSAYLLANKTIQADKIDSRGYGPTRPLASNTTPEGRAINRRIDVIINPSLTPGQ
jgi:outer membrane protein OmpA-like peptidoglycan-associated protein